MCFATYIPTFNEKMSRFMINKYLHQYKEYNEHVEIKINVHFTNHHEHVVSLWYFYLYILPSIHYFYK